MRGLMVVMLLAALPTAVRAESVERFSEPMVVVEVVDTITSFAADEDSVTRNVQAWRLSRFRSTPSRIEREDTSRTEVRLLGGPFTSKTEWNRFVEQRGHRHLVVPVSPPRRPPTRTDRPESTDDRDAIIGLSFLALLMLLIWLATRGGKTEVDEGEQPPARTRERSPARPVVHRQPLTERAPAERAPPPPPAAPVERRHPTLRDPETSEPLLVNDGEFEGGRPGQVWLWGKWMSPREAEAHLREHRKTQDRWTRQSREFQRTSDQKSTKALKDRTAELEREAQREREENEAREEAWRSLAKLEEVAEKHDMADILERADENAINEDGSLNIKYVNDLKNVLRNRLKREAQAPAESLSPDWVGEAILNTVDDARRNPLIRVGLGVLWGGATEVYYQSQAAWEAMQKRHDELVAEGRGHRWDLTEALRAGGRSFAEENLPIDTIKTVQDPKSSWTDLLTSAVSDAFTAADVKHSLRNLRGSEKALRSGKGIKRAVSFDDPIPLPGTKQTLKSPLLGRAGHRVSPRVRAKPHIPDLPVDRPDGWLRSMPEGSHIPPGALHEAGYTGKQLEGLAAVAKKHDVIISSRTTNMDSMRHIRDGTALPKTLDIKAKTINEIDRKYLGYDTGTLPEGATERMSRTGLVGFGKPRAPAFTGNESPELIKKINDRFAVRSKEFDDIEKKIKKMVDSGEYQLVRDGRPVKSLDQPAELHRVVDKQKGLTKPFAGDIDAVMFRDAKTGIPLTGDAYVQVKTDYMNSLAQGQHGAEYNVVEDLTRGLEPGTQQYKDAYETAVSIRNKQSDVHIGSAAEREVIMDMHPDGSLRKGPCLDPEGLPDWEPFDRVTVLEVL